MAAHLKDTPIFECTECGYQSVKYFGRCPQCNSWNSMVQVDANGAETEEGSEAPVKPVKICEIDPKEIRRIETGMEEFDRVLGGGVVAHSVILIGGEPGVGKSTLLLEISALLASQEKKVLYYSGEESATQIKLRAERLGINSDRIYLLTFGSLEDIQKHIQEIEPQFLIIDSIQTMHSKKALHNTGSVSALRFLTSEIIDIAKKKGITVFLIGHITKEGQLAGPKTLEHMVDAVLYFQGEIQTDVRILRAEKNRFGPLNELGVFQMGETGLKSVNDPSQIFIQHRQSNQSGIAVFPVISGMRTFLIEIQALVADSPLVVNPRRISIGFDNYKMAMLIAIIEKKLKLPFYKSDVFLNITGGMTIKETAADLAVCSALISSYKNIRISTNTVFIGEVGLTGEIRPVSFLENRLKEAIRQGLSDFYLPAAQAKIKNFPDIRITAVDNIFEFFNNIKGV
jgi:DNA repair protein RadA/Sms